jgi:hypothetical protein
MTSAKFITSSGHLTAYALSCGYVERRGARILGIEHGVYRTWDGAKWSYGGTLTAARRRLTTGLQERSWGQSAALAI